MDEITDFDRICAEALATQRAPGFALAVVRNAKLVYARGFGLADVARSVAVTPQTRFAVGSVTKQFTAAAILLLAERGKLGVDDRLETYVPGIPNGEAITLRMLLNHTSGLHNYPQTSERAWPSAGPISLSTIVPILATDRPDFVPGTQWAYSNANYALLTAVIAKAGRTDEASFLRANVFEPTPEKNASGSSPQFGSVRRCPARRSALARIFAFRASSAQRSRISRASSEAPVASCVGAHSARTQRASRAKVRHASSRRRAGAPIGAFVDPFSRVLSPQPSIRTSSRECASPAKTDSAERPAARTSRNSRGPSRASRARTRARARLRLERERTPRRRAASGRRAAATRFPCGTRARVWRASSLPRIRQRRRLWPRRQPRRARGRRIVRRVTRAGPRVERISSGRGARKPASRHPHGFHVRTGSQPDRERVERSIVRDSHEVREVHDDRSGPRRVAAGDARDAHANTKTAPPTGRETNLPPGQSSERQRRHHDAPLTA